MAHTTKPDLTFSDHGSIWLMTPNTPLALDWIAEHISEDAQRFGISVAVEPRYVPDLCEAADADGLWFA